MRLTRNLFAFAGGLGAIVALALLMAPTGGFPSRPRFQSVGIDETAPTGTGGLAAQRIGVGIGGAPAGAGAVDAAGTITGRGNPSAVFQSTTNPRVEWTMADAAVDNTRWDMGPQAETFTCRALNDAGGVINRWCEVERTGAVIDSVNLLGAAVRANGVALARATTAQIATSGAGMLIGDAIRISKSADTSRASTIALAIDPDLQITALPAGHYRVELSLVFTPGAGGSNFRIDSPASTFVIGVDRCAVSNAAATTSEALAIPCAGANVHRFVGSGGSVKALATGAISVFWAQDTSNAAATVLESDSWLQVTRLN